MEIFFSGNETRSFGEKQSIAHIYESVDLVQDRSIILNVAAGDIGEQCEAIDTCVGIWSICHFV